MIPLDPMGPSVINGGGSSEPVVVTVKRRDDDYRNKITVQVRNYGEYRIYSHDIQNLMIWIKFAIKDM